MNLDEFTNPGFSSQIATDKISRVLQEFTLLTSRAGFSVSRADLDQIDQAEQAVRDTVALYFATIREKAVERRANLERYKDIDVVSIGEDCLSRTIPTQWGLKRSAKLGELTHPFDLAVTPLPKVSQLIETDFEGYLDPANLVFMEERNFCKNQALSVMFNHEQGVKYAENDFELLRKSYEPRISNFRKRMSQGGKMVFLLHSLKKRPNAVFHIKKLKRVLRQSFSKADILLICVNTAGKGPLLDTPRHIDLEGEAVEVIDIDYPFEDYIWHAPSNCFTPEGHAFEKKLVSEIRRIIDQWMQAA